MYTEATFYHIQVYIDTFIYTHADIRTVGTSGCDEYEICGNTASATEMHEAYSMHATVERLFTNTGYQ